MNPRPTSAPPSPRPELKLSPVFLFDEVLLHKDFQLGCAPGFHLICLASTEFLRFFWGRCNNLFGQPVAALLQFNSNPFFETKSRSESDTSTRYTKTPTPHWTAAPFPLSTMPLKKFPVFLGYLWRCWFWFKLNPSFKFETKSEEITVGSERKKNHPAAILSTDIQSNGQVGGL